jgi:S1-C subfamily serine protease
VARLLTWLWMLVMVILTARLLPWITTWLADVGIVEPSFATGSASAGLLTVVALGAALAVGHVIGLTMARWIGPRGARGPGRSIDRVTGAAVGAVGVVAVMWLALPVVAGAPGPLSASVSQSRLAQTIDRSLPDPPDAMQALRRFTNDIAFPQVFDTLQATPDPGPPPVETGLGVAEAERVAASVVQVQAEACGRLQQGTGFVAQEAGGGRVLATNAHVVAGATGSVTVVAADGTRLRTDVVAFDPTADLALLHAPDSGNGTTGPAALQPLALADAPRSPVGGPGAVFGHPGGGPLRIAPARVTREVSASGRDIYGSPGAQREVLELSAALRRGDSGAPLVDPQGRVEGVVFAVAADRSDVAYAVSIRMLKATLDSVDVTVDGVDTGRCL